MYTDFVSKVEKADGGLLVTVAREIAGSSPDLVMVFAVTDRGVSRTTVGGEKLEPATPISAGPLKSGVKGEVGESIYAVAGEEEVKVPAGWDVGNVPIGQFAWEMQCFRQVHLISCCVHDYYPVNLRGTLRVNRASGVTRA